MPALAAFIEECKTGGTTEAELATQEKKGQPTGLFVTHPITGEQVEVWVGNYVLMSYGDGAVMACRRTTSATFAFAKKYGIADPQVIAVEAKPSATDAWAWYADKFARRHGVNSDALTAWVAGSDAVARSPRSADRQGIPGEKRPPGACATGASAASVTGAPHPHHPLR